MSVLADCFPQHLVRVGYVATGMTHFRKRHEERNKTRKSTLDKNCKKKFLKKPQKVVKKLSQKVIKKFV
jgi:hypothetical protein